MRRSGALGSGRMSWVQQGQWAVGVGMGFGILRGKKVGKGEGLPGLLGFVLRKKRRIILVPGLQ